MVANSYRQWLAIDGVSLSDHKWVINTEKTVFPKKLIIKAAQNQQERECEVSGMKSVTVTRRLFIR